MPRKSLSAPNRGTPQTSTASVSKKQTKSERKPRQSRTAEIDFIDTSASSPDPIAASPINTKLSKPKRVRRSEAAILAEENNGLLTEEQNVEEGPTGLILGEPQPENENEGISLDQQLEAWQEFAAEHYEMVEQLPLELHRNFRLLRELDDGCVAQSGKLQDQIRAYLAARMDLVRRFAVVAGAIQDAPQVDAGMEVDEVEREEVALVASRVEDHAESEPEEQLETGRDVEMVDQPIQGELPKEDGGNDEGQQEKGPALEKGETSGTEGQAGQESEKEAGGDVEMAADAPSTTQVKEAVDTDNALPTANVDVAVPDGSASAEKPAPPAAPPMPDLPPDMGSLIPDGEGGLVVANSTDQMADLVTVRASGLEPAADDPVGPVVNVNEGVASTEKAIGGADAVGTKAAEQEAANAEEKPSVPAPLTLDELPGRLLPEIGRLLREVVRNCEEKVALAVGAYNSIDRHIRALDSALSAQETSLILGLRPDTLPSSGVDQTLNLAGDTSGIPQNAAEEAAQDGVLVLGLGGSATGNRGKKRKGKKGRKGEDTGVPEETVAEVRDPEMENIDPNEPTYCYCQRVSYGTMVACDNEDCLLEWFHLPCTGLQHEPQGNWLCNECKPKIGLGMGGAGTVQPGIADKRLKKKKKRTT